MNRIINFAAGGVKEKVVLMNHQKELLYFDSSSGSLY